MNIPKIFTFHLLIGLPGSGKSYFVNQQGPGQYKVSLDDYKYISLEEALKKSFDDAEVLMFDTHQYSHCYRNCYIDGLILNKKTVEKIISFANEYFNKYHKESEFESVNFVLHIWNIDREACLHNDKLRSKTDINRKETSEITIKNANIEDMEDLGYDIEKHEVKKVSMKDKILDFGYEGRLESEEWSGGGTWGDCWGDRGVIEPEDDPGFDKFDNLLARICPNITYLQYKVLFNDCVELEEYWDGDYYGGRELCKRYVCNLEYLYDRMIEMNLIEEN